MQTQSSPIMHNWNLSSNGMDVIVKGTVYGHPRISDGRKINTSPLVKGVFSQDSGDEIFFHTHNTIYQCPLHQVDPSCQLTKKYLLETLPQEHERWDKWLDNDSTRPTTPFQGVDLPVPDGSYLLALDPDCPYIFTGVYQKIGSTYHWIIRNPYVNMGVYTDSVLCNKYDDQLNLLFDVRYFPQGCQQVKFYDIQLKGEEVLFYVVNVGQTQINYDENILNPWHYFQLLENMVEKKEEAKEEVKAQPPQEELPVEELSPYVAEENARISQENKEEHPLATLENTLEVEEEAIPDPLAYQKEADAEILQNLLDEEDIDEEWDELFPDSPYAGRKNTGELSEEYPEYPPRTMSLLDEVDSDDLYSKGKKQEQLTQITPEPEEFVEERVETPPPPKPTPVEIQIFDLSAAQIEEVPLLDHEMESAPVDFENMPTLNMEYFPEVNQSSVMELKLFPDDKNK